MFWLEKCFLCKKKLDSDWGKVYFRVIEKEKEKTKFKKICGRCLDEMEKSAEDFRNEMLGDKDGEEE